MILKLYALCVQERPWYQKAAESHQHEDHPSKEETSPVLRPPVLSLIMNDLHGAVLDTIVYVVVMMKFISTTSDGEIVMTTPPD